ncbi:hypothetical protein [Halococcus sp. AFM35]|uniref:hypothetical protein n=1 Tax=Halococcus sp. AFM35 TaxID=3421653 RepID=UPI003EBE846B
MGTVAIQWGVPYSLQDPWAHLDYIQQRDLASGNPYPGFHALTLTLISITRLPAIHWMTVIGVLSAAVGIFGVAAFLSQLPLSPRATQPAFIAFLPAISQGFVGRPFTVAFAVLLPIALLLIAHLFEYGYIPQQRINVLLIIIWCITPIWHPQLLWHISTIAAATVLIVWLSRSRVSRHLPTIENVSPLSRFGITAVLIPWLVLAVYMIIVTPVGGQIIMKTVGEYIVAGGVEEAAAASQGTGAFSFLTSTAAAQEALVRFAFPGLFLFGVGIAVFEQTKNWEFDGVFLTLTVAGGIMIVLFFFVFLFTSALGVERFVALVPLVLFPAVTYAFKEWRAARVGLMVCLLCTGVLGIYPSAFSGQAGASATAASPAGIEWVADYGANKNIVSSGISRQLKAATQMGAIWERYESITVEQWPWITNQSALVAIQAADRARMRQYTAESGNRTIRNMYNNFTTSCSMVYNNGGATICRT